MAVLKGPVGKLLNCLPLNTIEYAFAYGSGAFAQTGEDMSAKMVDFVVATNDSLKFHSENLKKNPKHYSSIRFLGSGTIFELQRKYAARVFYNTHIHYQGRLMKYGVVSTEDLQRDLLDWRWLYLAGRLHKPVVNVIEPSDSLAYAVNENRRSALQASELYKSRALPLLTAALLLLPETFNMYQFLYQIVALSYNGDFRMLFGEDKNKIKKITEGNAEHLERIYFPLLDADSRILVRGSRIEQDLSTAAIYHRLQLLPSGVLAKLQKTYNQRNDKQRDIEEVTFSLANHLDAPRQVAIALESIVAPAAWSQTVKNAITAGFFRSVIYSFSKIKKMFKSF